ncbi:MAG: 50S ribosomal protein L10 [Rickettsiales bacterium]|jgi:large subunit ribosomal protein L10|nr:50S ribosomal protein L10 [Rickettsiales bacterium]
MNRTKKQESVNLARDILSGNEMCILLNYKGLSAGDFIALRTSLKENGANVRVFKNTFVKRAIDGTNFSPMTEFFHDQMAISYSKDPISLSSSIVRFARENENLRIQAASFNGEITDIKFVEELALLGSINDVRARFIGVLKAPCSQLVRLFVAYGEKK